VRTRFRLEGPGLQDRGLYEARGLTENYRLVVDYGPDIQKVSGDAEVYWKIKNRESGGVKTLPEAPLWRLERELARRDMQTFEFYKRPPPTKSAKSSRRSGRPGSPPGLRSPDVGALSPAPRRRRGSFAPRQTFPADDRPHRRSSAAIASKRDSQREKRGVRSRSQARSASFDRETEIRETMPHKREKDKAWWEGRRVDNS
jgi:hypothetical protein